MVDLIILACLTAAPAECERHIMTAEGTVPACIFSMPMVAATWQMERPKWEVRNVTCREHMDEA